MTQRMSIGVASQADATVTAVISYVSIRERLLRFLLGRKEKITIIVPSDSVKELTIHESIGKGALP